MPTYHYRCSGCDQHVEVVQSMTDDPLTECAACGGEMYKVLRPVGIVLKGSGFYRTDNRSTSTAGKGESKADSKADSSKADSKSESKADSKSESKADSKGGGKSVSSDSSDSRGSGSSTPTKSTEAKSA